MNSTPLRLLSNFITDLGDALKSLTKVAWGRFILGGFLGMFFVLCYWGGSLYCHVQINYLQGIIGSLILVLIFGFAGAYGKLDQLIDGL